MNTHINKLLSLNDLCAVVIGGKGNIGYPMAEALKVPRILEAEPGFPVVQPIGKNSFDFYYQPHFEKWCKYLNDNLMDKNWL